MIENGAETIWELKTGKRRWSADQLEFDPQPTTYGIAARELGFTDAKSKILVTLKWVKPDVQVEDLVRHHRDERELAEIALGSIMPFRQVWIFRTAAGNARRARTQECVRSA